MPRLVSISVPGSAGVPEFYMKEIIMSVHNHVANQCGLAHMIAASLTS